MKAEAVLTWLRRTARPDLKRITRWVGWVLLYVHRNRRFITEGREPRTATSTFTQLLSSESRVSIAVRLKRLTASVSTCRFQTQHAIILLNGWTAPESQSAPTVWTEVKERPEGPRGGNSNTGKVDWIPRHSPCLNPLVSTESCGSQYIWGCTSGGVYLTYIYTHARWELP